eukprot:SAG11_NODE_822_length_7009_cov_7.776122_6_plen_82_part_00
MTNLQRTIRNLGQAGVPCLGYHFSLTGAFGRSATVARGGATSEGFVEADGYHFLEVHLLVCMPVSSQMENMALIWLFFSQR